MAVNCILRAAAMKLKVCPLQSLARGHLLKCSTTASSSQFYHTSTLQPLLCPREKMAKQNDLCVTPLLSQSGIILQNVKQFSLSAKQMAAHGHDHTKLWTAEKVLSVSLLGIIPTAFLIPSPFMDYLLAISVVMHNHWGIEAVVVDYVRPKMFGNVIPKVALGAVYVMSITTLAGLFYFVTSDVGIVVAIKQLWQL